MRFTLFHLHFILLMDFYHKGPQTILYLSFAILSEAAIVKLYPLVLAH